MNVVFDTTAPGTELEMDGSSGVTITRTGVISEIDAGATSDPYVLLRAADAAIAQAGQTHPALSKAVINRLLVRPAGGTNDCTFSVTYRAGPLAKSGGGVRWLIEDDSTLAQEEEELDLNGNPIQVIFTAMGKGTKNASGFLSGAAPAGPDEIPTPETVAAEAAQRAAITNASKLQSFDQEHPLREVATFPAPVLRPRRALIVSGYMQGRPSFNMLLAQGTVNRDAWEGMAKGYWLCSKVGARAEHGGFLNGVDPFADAGSLIRVEAQFLSKVYRDWGHHFLHRTIKGKIAQQMCSPAFSDRIKQIIDGEYSTEQVRCNGFTKAGLYDLADFAAIFGI